MSLPFDTVARLTHPEDNCAIATRPLDAGEEVALPGRVLKLPHTVLEGHRFAVRPIPAGEHLLSWGTPFGRADRAIAPGDYLCNLAVLDNLRTRKVAFALPESANFSDVIPPLDLGSLDLAPAAPLVRYAEPAGFLGYARPGGRGAGTRNVIVLLGTSSLTAGFVRELERRLRPAAQAVPGLDGVVAVAHTEGAYEAPNNRELLLRTLAGFAVHPNVAAVLAVEGGTEAVGNAALERFMRSGGYPLDAVPHHFVTRTEGFDADLETAEALVRGWLPAVGAARREVPLLDLKAALQCGGSDAFSGISGNPLVAWVAREIIRHGGSANLAETDELLGAERYMLERVRDRATAERFLATLERFERWAARHGHSADGNPTGGNVYRGLYNIYLKSLGAAAKRHPEVPLDAVTEYAEPMRTPGLTFMDSPGNDLESIAGQVAAGCNLIFFVTGNGSITNFPFVPTVKVVTTSRRYALLAGEMDVDAGAYLDGRTSMDELGRDTFALALEVASGRASAGERAGHAQVQIWRNWRLAAAPTAEAEPAPPDRGAPSGDVVRIRGVAGPSDRRLRLYRTPTGVASRQVGLVLPTSLCAGQIARMAVEAFELDGIGPGKLDGFVALAHTEGCGSSGSPEFLPTMLGYATHPLVRYALLLEHGCEKTHNAYFRQQMEAGGLDPDRFGWASIQLDGGIARVTDTMARWFGERLVGAPALGRVEVGLEAMRLGLLAAEPPPPDLERQLARLIGGVVAAGGTVVLPAEPRLRGLLGALGADPDARPSLGYARRFAQPGLHLMDMAGAASHWVETLTGLGATGVEVVLAYAGDEARQGHPLIPVLQLARAADADLRAGGDETPSADALLDRIAATLEGAYTPKAGRQGNVDFQLTRGRLGVSL